MEVSQLSFTFDISEWEKYRNLTWRSFISDIVLGGGLSVTDITDYSQPWVWVRHHWAPVWLTCGVCQEEDPVHYVLKVETLEQDITSIMEGEFGMTGDFLFPKVKTMGSKDVSGERENSNKFLSEYFTQLTRDQILELYEMYKLDFIFFDYKIDKYIKFAI